MILDYSGSCSDVFHHVTIGRSFILLANCRKQNGMRYSMHSVLGFKCPTFKRSFKGVEFNMNLIIYWRWHPLQNTRGIAAIAILDMQKNRSKLPVDHPRVPAQPLSETLHAPWKLPRLPPDKASPLVHSRHIRTQRPSKQRPEWLARALTHPSHFWIQGNHIPCLWGWKSQLSWWKPSHDEGRTLSRLELSFARKASCMHPDKNLGTFLHNSLRRAAQQPHHCLSLPVLDRVDTSQ